MGYSSQKFDEHPVLKTQSAFLINGLEQEKLIYDALLSSIPNDIIYTLHQLIKKK